MEMRFGLGNRCSIEEQRNFEFEGVVAPWCNPLILQPGQSGGKGSDPG